MKVKQLINKLKNLPQEAEVMVMEQGSGDEFYAIDVSEPFDNEEYNEVYILI